MALPISKGKALREWRLYLFVIPALLMVLMFSYYPVMSAVYYSFFEWDGGASTEFIGLANYERAFGDQVFLKSFLLILILVLANIVKLVPSIIVAVLIHRLKNDGAQYWYRVAVVLPMVVPQIVNLFIWKFFFDPNLGVLNRLLDITGGKWLLVQIDQVFDWDVFYMDQTIGWLSTSELVIPTLILWGFPWIGQVGVLLYLAGLQGIGKELYESSEIDGCGPFRQFWHIEFPLILTQVRISLILMVIATLQGYWQQYLLLGIHGGPNGMGMVPGLWMFNRAFQAAEFGYACALGMVIFVFILGLTWLNNKYVRIDK